MWKDSGGLTLVEVLVTLAIVFIVFFGLNSAGLVVLEKNIENSLRDEAVSVADEEMMAARRIPFDTLPVTDCTLALPSVARTVRGMSAQYWPTRTIGYLDGDNRQVTIDVIWKHYTAGNKQGKDYSHREISIVRRK